MGLKWYWYIPFMTCLLAAIWDVEHIKWTLSAFFYLYVVKSFSLDTKVIGMQIVRKERTLDLRKLK
jgi:hypothetical protein